MYAVEWLQFELPNGDSFVIRSDALATVRALRECGAWQRAIPRACERCRTFVALKGRAYCVVCGPKAIAVGEARAGGALVTSPLLGKRAQVERGRVAA